MGSGPQALGADIVNVRFGAQVDDEFLLTPSTTLRVAPGVTAKYGLMEARIVTVDARAGTVSPSIASTSFAALRLIVGTMQRMAARMRFSSVA